jgi:hypothetical protein
VCNEIETNEDVSCMTKLSSICILLGFPFEDGFILKQKNSFLLAFLFATEVTTAIVPPLAIK